MKDFETFKQSRSKTDPSSKSLSDAQWQQAYAAYCASRERVGRKRGSKSEASAEAPLGRSRRSKRSRGRGETSPNRFLNPRQLLIERLRANSAYSELRMLVDTLALVATGLILVGLVIKFYFFTAVLGLLAALFGGFLQLIVVFALRKLAQVLVDVADLLVERKQREVGGSVETATVSKADELDPQ